MNGTRKKITVITTGGTIGCKESGGMLRPAAKLSPVLIESLGAGAPNADFEILPLMCVLSENMTASGIVGITEAVLEASAHSDGVIVAHGTDTLEYTAAAVAYAVGLDSVPVVFASAQFPPCNPRSDAPLCLEAAAAAASSDLKGALACFAAGDTARVCRASRLLPYLPYSGARHFLGASIAKYRRGGIALNPDYSERADELPAADISPLSGAPDVMLVSPAALSALPEPNAEVRAIALYAFHSGTLPTARPDFADYCRRCTDRGISLYALCSSDDVHYESAALFDALGIRVLPRMAPAAAFVKLRLRLLPDRSLGGDLFNLRGIFKLRGA